MQGLDLQVLRETLVALGDLLALETEAPIAIGEDPLCS